MKKRGLITGLLLAAVSLLLMFFLLEGLVRLSGWIKWPAGIAALAGGNNYRNRLRLEALNRELSGGDATKSPYMLLHPYFGYTNVPGNVSVHGKTVNNLGFPTEVDFPYRKQNPDEYVIVFLGGSVAEILTASASPTLIAKLKETPEFADREIVIINCATGAYKQPQQLLILTYLISQGMEFDCAVNLDGFNEVAVSGMNIKKKTSIYYPAGFYWKEMINYLTSGSAGFANDPRCAELNYRRLELKTREEKVLSFLLDTPARHSAAARLFLTGYTGWLRIKGAEVKEGLEAALQRRASDWTRKMIHGPAGEDELEEAVGNWRRCSRLMEQLCDDVGALYIHLLQPNQYDPAGKTLTAAERERAYNRESPFRKWAVLGYPLLREEARRFNPGEVTFVDLSMFFNDLSVDIYADDCCHYNQLGNDLLMEEIGGIIYLKESERGGGRAP